MKQLLTSSWQKRLPIVGTVHFSRHPKAKRISIKVAPTGEIRVTVPRRVSQKAAFQFALENSDWIIRTRAKVLKRIEEHAGLPLNLLQFEDISAAAYFLMGRLEQLTNQFGFHFNHVTLKTSF